MALKVEQIGEVAVIVPAGPHLDASAADSFKAELAPVIESHKKVLVDMSQLRFVDSTGLGTILSCVRRLSAHGGEMKLCSVSAPVFAVFEMTRMHKIIDILPDRPAGLKAFGASPPSRNL